MISQKFITPQMLKRVFDVVLRSFRSLASWSSKIKEQSAYKYSNPCNEAEYKRQGGKSQPGHEYEKVVRFNYSSEEMSALLDVIGMIKGLGSLMMRSELLCVPLVRRYIHDEVQVFLQQEVARPLRKAHKRKRRMFFTHRNLLPCLRPYVCLIEMK
jgi:cytoplasmic FMR1 interacting protein